MAPAARHRWNQSGKAVTQSGVRRPAWIRPLQCFHRDKPTRRSGRRCIGFGSQKRDRLHAGDSREIHRRKPVKSATRNWSVRGRERVSRRPGIPPLCGDRVARWAGGSARSKGQKILQEGWSLEAWVELDLASGLSSLSRTVTRRLTSAEGGRSSIGWVSAKPETLNTWAGRTPL
jgi:hypothetical protein